MDSKRMLGCQQRVEELENTIRHKQSEIDALQREIAKMKTEQRSLVKESSDIWTKIYEYSEDGLRVLIDHMKQTKTKSFTIIYTNIYTTKPNYNKNLAHWLYAETHMTGDYDDRTLNETVQKYDIKNIYVQFRDKVFLEGEFSQTYNTLEAKVTIDY